jgi:hypothetical protein
MTIARPTQPRKANLWQTAKAVACAFIGIRRANEHGAVRFSPIHVILVGIICAAVFVLSLIALVRWVVAG